MVFDLCIFLLIQMRQFSLEKALLWIMESYFSWKQGFEVKHVLMVLFLTNTTSCFTRHSFMDMVWITCGLLWCFYQMFGLSFWRHPFTAEDPLMSKWFNAQILQIRPEGEQIFIFWWIIPLPTNYNAIKPTCTMFVNTNKSSKASCLH